MMEMMLNSAARQVCGDHFISGRPVEDIIERSVIGDREEFSEPVVASEHYPFDKEKFFEALENIEVNQTGKWVSVSAGPYVGTARYYGDQGCVIIAPMTDHAFFDPKPVPRPSKEDNLFPDQDILASGKALPSSYDRATLEAAAARALHPERHGTAIMVVHKGEVVLERYADHLGITKDTPTQNWSMGKSILAALIGRLEALGELSLNDPAPIPAWSVDEGDPRQDIKIIDLMQMTGGLSCTRSEDPWFIRGPSNFHADHHIIYGAPVDVIQLAIS
ncbi:MAG: serine hydrolase, partial [Pseudomonadota bacterium]